LSKYSYLDAEVKPGYVFTYTGEAYECEKCENRSRCHGSLNIGFTYRVVKRTDGVRIYCVLRGSEIAPYEIALEPLVLLAPSGKVKTGAVMELDPDVFCKSGCSRIGDCPVVFNKLVAGRRVRILEKVGGFNCPEKNLVLVKAEISD
jgi:uncharacterized protein (UPF0179 family)